MSLLRQMLVALLLLAPVQFASADEESAFSAQAFTQAQSAGEPILVRVHASWCPVCKKQGAILKEFRDNGKLAGLRQFKVNFDTQKNVVNSFGVTNQSTLIVFKGGRETGRLVGGADASVIETLLSRAL